MLSYVKSIRLSATARCAGMGCMSCLGLRNVLLPRVPRLINIPLFKLTVGSGHDDGTLASVLLPTILT